MLHVLRQRMKTLSASFIRFSDELLEQMENKDGNKVVKRFIDTGAIAGGFGLAVIAMALAPSVIGPCMLLGAFLMGMEQVNIRIVPPIVSTILCSPFLVGALIGSHVCGAPALLYQKHIGAVRPDAPVQSATNIERSEQTGINNATAEFNPAADAAPVQSMQTAKPDAVKPPSHTR